METRLLRSELQEVFRDIVEGKVVKRSRHELKWGTRDVTTEFVDALGKAGYTQRSAGEARE